MTIAIRTRRPSLLHQVSLNKLSHSFSIFQPFCHHSSVILSSFFCLLVNTFCLSPPSFGWQYVSDEVYVVDSSPPSSLQPYCLPSAVEYFLQYSPSQACSLAIFPCAAFSVKYCMSASVLNKFDSVAVYQLHLNP